MLGTWLSLLPGEPPSAQADAAARQAVRPAAAVGTAILLIVGGICLLNQVRSVGTLCLLAATVLAASVITGGMDRARHRTWPRLGLFATLLTLSVLSLGLSL